MSALPPEAGSTRESCNSLDYVQHSHLIAKVAKFALTLEPGDYLEFGVFQGASLIKAYHAHRIAFQQILARFAQNEAGRREQETHWGKKRFVGFDSFAGLPAMTGVDAGGPFGKGSYACEMDVVTENLRKAQVNLDKVKLVPGWFNETLTPETRESLGLKRANIVHIDCDLYESTRVALDFITPLLDDGSVLIFDDWFQFRGHPQKGEQRAFGEWLAAHPEWLAQEYQKEGVWRNSFILNRHL